MHWAFFVLRRYQKQLIPPRIQLSKIGFCKRPIDQFVQECLNKLRAHVAVVDVVGVLPDVDS